MQLMETELGEGASAVAVLVMLRVAVTMTGAAAPTAVRVSATVAPLTAPLQPGATLKLKGMAVVPTETALGTPTVKAADVGVTMAGPPATVTLIIPGVLPRSVSHASVIVLELAVTVTAACIVPAEIASARRASGILEQGTRNIRMSLPFSFTPACARALKALSVIHR
jgi:hypothetical protein